MAINSNPGNVSTGGIRWKSQLFTSSGTWVRPSSVDTVMITAIGGGGSGNSTAVGSAVVAAGDGGQYVYKAPVDVSSSGSVTVTIGSGGAAIVGNGSAAQNGNNGGATSFGALLSVSGGAGGNTSPSSQLNANTCGAQGGREDREISGASNPCGAGGVGGLGEGNNPGGGGGLILDDSGVAGGNSGVTSNPTAAQGGCGYGAGGAGTYQISGLYTSGAGADGALLVEWQE